MIRCLYRVARLMILIALLLELLASTAGATVTFVQGTGNSSSTSGTTIAVAYGTAPTLHNLLVVSCGHNSDTATVSISDTNTNTWATAIGPTTLAGSARTYTFYAADAKAGASTVTCTSSATTSYRTIIINEFSGATNTSPLDVTSGASGSTGTTLNSGSATTTSANELIYGYLYVGSIATKGASFTNAGVTSDGIVSEYKNVTSTGSYNADGTQSTSSIWIAQMATFKDATQPGGPKRLSLLGVGD